MQHKTKQIVCDLHDQAWHATNNDQGAIASLLADAAEAEIQLRKTCVSKLQLLYLNA